MKRIVLLAGVVVLAGGAGLGVMRWRLAHTEHRHGGIPVSSIRCICCQDPHLHHLLGLNKDQIQRLSALDDGFNAESESLEDTVNGLRIELAHLIRTRPQKDAQVDRCIKEIGNTQMDLERHVLKHLYDIKAILNDAQQQQFMSVVLKDLGRPFQ